MLNCVAPMLSKKDARRRSRVTALSALGHVLQVGLYKNEENVSTIQGGNNGTRRPIEIRYSKASQRASAGPKPIVIQAPFKDANIVPKQITIQVPTPFPLKDVNAVPWNYTAKVQVEDSPKNRDVTNISGIGGMTRSGRIYTPEGLGGGKSKEEEERTRKGKSKGKETFGNNMGKIVLSEQEAYEFLKVMRQSEYKVVYQLN